MEEANVISLRQAISILFRDNVTSVGQLTLFFVALVRPLISFVPKLKKLVDLSSSLDASITSSPLIQNHPLPVTTTPNSYSPSSTGVQTASSWVKYSLVRPGAVKSARNMSDESHVSTCTGSSALSPEEVMGKCESWKPGEPSGQVKLSSSIGRNLSE